MIGLMADVIGSFRTIGRVGAFLALLFLTPFLGLLVIFAFPALPKSICMQDYHGFHAGITYRYKKRIWRGKQYFVVVNDVDVVLSSFEFTEYFAVVETRKQYLRKKKLFKNEEINT